MCPSLLPLTGLCEHFVIYIQKSKETNSMFIQYKRSYIFWFSALIPVISTSLFSDRFRTAVNVLGDALGAGIVHHFTKDQLAMDSTPSTLDDYDQEERAPIINGDTMQNDKYQRKCSLY